MKNILLVEDDVETTKVMKLYIHSQLHNLFCCSTGTAAISRINNFDVDLVILDISLPDMSGFDVCKQVRGAGFSAPIIMLTSRAEETDKVLALDLGADDYVTKPFGGLEFMSRINALLRRADRTSTENGAPKKEICNKEVVIDIGKRKATLRSDRLDLTHKEFDLLVLLASNPGRTFNRHELLEHIWGEKFEGYVNTVTTHINRLRNKLETDIDKPEYILTSWGVGYRFSD